LTATDRRVPTLLVVDDEEQILSALQRCLRRESYELLTETSPSAALRILQTRPVDAILSDQKMPGMSGVQFLEQAAAIVPDARRMLITGWTEEISEEGLEVAGVCAIVTKPWDDARLKATLRKALDRTRTPNSEKDEPDTPDRSSDYSLLR
jgi:response regulator RpfG family c-di-GMP phosphodiesterase